MATLMLMLTLTLTMAALCWQDLVRQQKLNFLLGGCVFERYTKKGKATKKVVRLAPTKTELLIGVHIAGVPIAKTPASHTGACCLPACMPYQVVRR